MQLASHGLTYNCHPCPADSWCLLYATVKENAAEACATQCKAEQDAAAAATPGKDAPVREAYDTCYTKCVAQETKEVAEEREKVSLRQYMHPQIWCSHCRPGKTLLSGSLSIL